MWNVFIPSLVALFIGLVLFLVILPRLSLHAYSRIQTSSRMDDFQKLKLLNFLDWLSGSHFPTHSQRSINLLSIYIFVLLGFQHYFLLHQRGFMAGLMVAGMFALIVAHSISDL